MKIISRLLYAIVTIAGVVLASMNMQLVKVTYLPALEISPVPEGAYFEFPLALLLLAVLVAGVLIAGLGTLLEHIRLRAGLRKQSKLNARLEQELDSARAALEAANARADEASRRAEVSSGGGEDTVEELESPERDPV